VAHSRTNSRIAQQQRVWRFSAATGVCHPPADYIYTWQLGYASCVVLSLQVLCREGIVLQSRVYVVMDNTDWPAAAAMVGDLELDRSFDAEYQGMLQAL
jgi:hypothetical protein